MLWLLANQGDARAYNAALMLYVGLRTGEAAAPKIGDIALADDDKYGSYFVAGKIRGGIYEPYPKRRLAIAPLFWAVNGTIHSASYPATASAGIHGARNRKYAAWNNK